VSDADIDPENCAATSSQLLDGDHCVPGELAWVATAPAFELHNPESPR
jgi:hypothetical protein